MNDRELLGKWGLYEPLLAAVNGFGQVLRAALIVIERGISIILHYVIDDFLFM